MFVSELTFYRNYVILGDIILAINGLEVNHSSINQVLLKVNGDSEVGGNIAFLCHLYSA